MAKRRRTVGAPKRKKRKSPVRRAARSSVDVAKAAARLAGKIERLREELKQIRRALSGRKRGR